MKKSKLSLLLTSLLLVILSVDLSAAGCGNDAPAGPGGGGNPSEPKTPKGDPVVPYTGNEFKEIDDLKVWGGTGEEALFWKRHANSRAVGGANLFGMGHYWRHSYQWDLTFLSKDSSGRNRRSLVTPGGATFIFTKINSTTWAAPVGCEFKLVSQGEDFTLLTKDSKRYFFKKFVSGTKTYYLMTEFYDTQGNKYTVTYNSENQVERITETAGRFLNVSYQTKSANKVDFSSLATFSTTPLTPGEWMELPVTNTNAYRYVRVVCPDRSYGNLAEVEFYD
jgi:hypothetical protein